MSEYNLEILKSNSENKELGMFLNDAYNSTIFHRPAFLEYHNESKFNHLKDFSFYHFIFKDTKKIIKAFIPGAIYIDENNVRIFKTPFYSSHGGLVYDSDIYFEETEKIIDLFLENLKNEGVKEIYFSQTSDCYCGDEKEKNNYLKYIFQVKGFVVHSIDMLMIIKIEKSNLNTFHNTIQRQINQALKNKLEFKAETGIDEDSYELLLKSQTRLGGRPTHSYEELKKINSIFPENIFTFKTLHEGKIIAGITGIKCNDEVLNTFYIFDDEEKRDLKGMQFTYFNVFNFAAENKFKYIDLGPGTFGLTPHYSLISYKEKYGSVPDLRITYIRKFD